MDKWVCPNDRQLALRAKLSAGWTSQSGSAPRCESLTLEEQEVITAVVVRAEQVETAERERVGKLVDRLENMKRLAIGNGKTNCVLCGEEFGLLASSPTVCVNCHKAVCSKCSVDTRVNQGVSVWLCKLCSEHRELWKKSGAWFYRAMPRYILPTRKPDAAADMAQGPKRISGGDRLSSSSSGQQVASPSRVYTTSWNKLSVKTSDKHESMSASSANADSILNLNDDSDDDENGDTLPQQRTAIAKSLPHAVKPVTQAVKPLPPPSDSEKATQDRLLSVKDSPNNTELPIMQQTSPTTSQPQNQAPPPTKTDTLDEADIDNAFSVYREQPNKKHDELQLHDLNLAERRDTRVPELGLLEFSLLYDAGACELRITLKRAQGLKAMDSNGLSDPFVKLNLLPSVGKSFKLRSTTIKKNLNPEWNETLVYYGITEEDLCRKSLQLCVLDEDPIGYDFLGETRVQLKSLRDRQQKDYSVYLEHLIPVEETEDPGDRGRILLSLLYDTNKKQLTVGVIRCAALAAMDSNGYSDPYVKLYLKPDKSKNSKRKTHIRKKTLNPEFNEKFTYDISLAELPKKTLEVTVWDHDVGKASDYIGGVQLGINSRGAQLQHWHNALKTPNQTIQRWHNLVDGPLPEVSETVKQ